MNPATKRAVGAVVFLILGALPAAAQSKADPAAQRRSAHDTYRELVEINTTQSVGDTLQAARAMAARLVAAGLPAADVQVFEVAPKRGNLVARLRGTGKRKPLLLLAHLDVVEARREDWTTDPFKLVEQDGYFYGRGTGDDKAMAAVFVANLIRYRTEGYRPDRDILLVLSTDEEIADVHHLGINWLLEKHRDLIDAELALNEGGSLGTRDGKPLWNAVQTAEKLFQSFWLEVRNPGGHSSLPRKDNAIYQLAEGLTRLAKFQFPAQLNATTRLFFGRMAGLEKGPLAADMKAVAAEPPSSAAVQRLSQNPTYNAQLRTTCVPTRLEGGHADNALPQLARAMVNCRILPGVAVEEVRTTLVKVLGNEKISVTPAALDTPSQPSVLTPELLGQIETLSNKFWPGIPVVATMSSGATDGRFLRNAGIPTYGHSGLASDIADVRAHGRDERVQVEAFDRSQEYLYQLVKVLAGG